MQSAVPCDSDYDPNKGIQLRVKAPFNIINSGTVLALERAVELS
ncbi:hypothetical protein [Abyssisolibacter fermentans]|nr:hypothetical protein [Abyssisolibacter fermentans]